MNAISVALYHLSMTTLKSNVYVIGVPNLSLPLCSEPWKARIIEHWSFNNNWASLRQPLYCMKLMIYLFTQLAHMHLSQYYLLHTHYAHTCQSWSYHYWTANIWNTIKKVFYNFHKIDCSLRVAIWKLHEILEQSFYAIDRS